MLQIELLYKKYTQFWLDITLLDWQRQIKLKHNTQQPDNRLH